jgi:hypothetical protein
LDAVHQPLTIVDMSDEHLRKLCVEVVGLDAEGERLDALRARG